MINVDTAATAIFGSNGVTSSKSPSTSRTPEKKSSFQDELKASEAEDTKDIQETEQEPETEEVSKKEDNTKSEKKEEKPSADKQEEKAETKADAADDSKQSLKGEVSMAEAQGDDYAALSDQVKSFMLKNGGQFNLNAVNLMTATTRAEIANVSPSVDYSSIKMSDNDAKFFSDLVNKTDMSAKSVAAEFQKVLNGYYVL